MFGTDITKICTNETGTEVNNTPVLSPSDEDQLWKSGILNLHSPIGLLRAIFFYNGMNFCLCGGQEHRNWKLSQITHDVVPVNGQLESDLFTKKMGQNRGGGLKQLRLDNKIVCNLEMLMPGADTMLLYWICMPLESSYRSSYQECLLSASTAKSTI